MARLCAKVGSLHADFSPPNVHGPSLISLVELFSAFVIVTKVFVHFDLLPSVIIALGTIHVVRNQDLGFSDPLPSPL